VHVSDAGSQHSDPQWLEAVVDRATRNVAEGGGPFAAMVVHDGAVLAEGVNRVTRDLDPTAHAEVVAIRGACRAIGNHVLAGAVMVASCEPCPLCLAASLWARVDRVIYAADRNDAARAGFDDATFYDLFDRPRGRWDVPVVQVRLESARQPFEAWLANPDRIAY
jgi:guanine deaminase